MKSRLSFLTGKKLHVFIADDDPDDLEFFKQTLSEFAGNIKITIAKDGKELLDFLQVVKPDLIFLDINMPCMNGIDCLRAIRKQKELNDLPVIMYSTSIDKSNIDLTYSLGANLYIHKPSNLAQIKERLNQTLSFSLSELVPQRKKESYVLNIAD